MNRAVPVGGVPLERAPRSAIPRWIPTISVLCGLAAILFGIASFQHLFWQRDGDLAARLGGFVDSVLKAAQLFTLDPPPLDQSRGPSVSSSDASTAPVAAAWSPWTLLAARLFALVAVAGGVYGLLSSVLPGWVIRVRLTWLAARRGLRRLLASVPFGGRLFDEVFPPHDLVFGLGRIGTQLVRDLRRRPTGGTPRAPVIAVENDPSNRRIAEAQRLGAIVLIGDPRNPSILSLARPDAARRAFVVCGDDSTNVEVATEVRSFVSARPRSALPDPLRCYVNLVDAGVADSCRRNDIFRDSTGGTAIDTFNVLESTARLLIGRDLGVLHAPRDDQVAYWIVIGFGAMGRVVALEAGRLAHFGNRKRLRMSIVDNFDTDPESRAARDRFLAQYPAFCPDPREFNLLSHAGLEEPSLDDWDSRRWQPAEREWRSQDDRAVEYAVNAEFLPMGRCVDAPELIASLRPRLADPRVAPCLVVCFDDDHRNFEAASRVHAKLLQEGLTIPIYVYLPEETGLRKLLDEDRTSRLPGVRAFGPCEESACASEIERAEVAAIAKSLHETYVRGRHDRVGLLAPAWNDLQPTYRHSNEEAAAHVDIKLAAAGCVRVREEEGGEVVRVLPNPGLLSEMEHNRWMAERLLDGWRFGPDDDRAKRRSSLVGWSALVRQGHEETRKDLEQIHAILDAVGTLEGGRNRVVWRGSRPGDRR